MIIKKANFPKQEYNRDFKQITTNDSRFYEDGNKTYPSVTYVLSYYPKGKNFEDWLKKVGYASDFIAKKAADEGTLVHNLAERYLRGDKIDLMDEDQNPKYDIKIWKMFLRFIPGARLFKQNVNDDEVAKAKVCSTAVTVALRRNYMDPVPYLADDRVSPADLARSPLIHYLFTIDGT